MSNECKLEEKLLGLVLGELDADEQKSLREHVDGCSHCKSIFSDLKVGVEKFHVVYPEVPDVPKKLSQARFEEILQIAKELETESPDAWKRKPDGIPTEDEPSNPGAWWVVIIGIILAILIVIILLRPWDKSGRVTVDPDNGTSGTDKMEEGRKDSGRTPTPSDAAALPNADDQTEPFTDPNRPYKRIVSIVSFQRKTPIESTPTGVGAFKPIGKPVQLRASRLHKLSEIKDAIIDDRPRYRMTYATDSVSANALITLNDTVLLAGGRGAKSIRFDSSKNVVIVDGNEEELREVRTLQRFVTDPTLLRLGPPPATNRSGDLPQNDLTMVKALKRAPLKPSLVVPATTFAEAMKTLSEWGGLALVDRSDQSNAVVTLQFENVSIWGAITQLCKAVDVNPHVADGTITLLPEPFAPKLTVTLVKVSPARYDKLLADRRVTSPAALLATTKIALPDGAGVETTKDKTVVIIHHNDQATEEILTLLTPCLLTKDEIK